MTFNDQRFGQIAGWKKLETKFAFQYHLQDSQKNRVVVQRGRFAEVHIATMKSLITIILRNHIGSRVISTLLSCLKGE